MATSFDKIIDQALITIRDYSLDDIYENDPPLFYQIFTGYIIRGLPKFETCMKPLTYDLQAQEFSSDFDLFEINIIANWAVISWYEDNLQDVLEFKEPLRDVDFNKYSTGQNLRPRQEYLTRLRNVTKQDTTNYLFLHMDDLDGLGKGS